MSLNSIGSNIPVEVAKGGTGLASVTEYAVVCGGTSATGALQQVSGVGTSGQVLTSNGAAALPTWQAAASTPGMVFFGSQTESGGTAITFDGFYSASHPIFFIAAHNITAGTTGDTLIAEVSTNNGSSWLSTGYTSAFYYYDSGGSGVETSTASGLLSRATDFSDASAGNFICNLNGVYSTNRAALFMSCSYPSVALSNDYSGAFAWSSLPSGTQLTSIRFRMSSGTISGTANMYYYIGS